MGVKTDSQYRAAAKRDYHRDGSIEIDESAVVSNGDDTGAYVQARVWVDDADCDENTLGENEE